MKAGWFFFFVREGAVLAAGSGGGREEGRERFFGGERRRFLVSRSCGILRTRGGGCAPRIFFLGTSPWLGRATSFRPPIEGRLVGWGGDRIWGCGAALPEGGGGVRGGQGRSEKDNGRGGGVAHTLY